MPLSFGSVPSGRSIPIIANFILSLTSFPCRLPFHCVSVHRFLVSFFLYHLTLNTSTRFTLLVSDISSRALEFLSFLCPPHHCRIFGSHSFSVCRLVPMLV